MQSELKIAQNRPQRMDVLNSVFKCAKRYWLAESQVRLTPGASDRCVHGHWTELRGSLYSIRHLWGFAAAEQKRMLMPNCWQRKDQRHCYICRLLLLLLPPLLLFMGFFSLSQSQLYSHCEELPILLLWLSPIHNCVLAVSCIWCIFHFRP